MLKRLVSLHPRICESAWKAAITPASHSLVTEYREGPSACRRADGDGSSSPAWSGGGSASDSAGSSPGRRRDSAPPPYAALRLSRLEELPASYRISAKLRIRATGDRMAVLRRERFFPLR